MKKATHLPTLPLALGKIHSKVVSLVSEIAKHILVVNYRIPDSLKTH